MELRLNLWKFKRVTWSWTRPSGALHHSYRL